LLNEFTIIGQTIPPRNTFSSKIVADSDRDFVSIVAKKWQQCRQNRSHYISILVADATGYSHFTPDGVWYVHRAIYATSMKNKRRNFPSIGVEKMEITTTKSAI
jgi:hypothetical protein